MRSFVLLLLLALQAFSARADDWPQWMGPRRDNIWREEGILRRFPEGGPKVLWRVPVAGGYSGPAVAKGKVYVTDYVLAKNVREPDFDPERIHQALGYQSPDDFEAKYRAALAA